MRVTKLQLVLVSGLALTLAGCSGGGGNGPSPSPSPSPTPSPTNITVTFTNSTPQAAAVQMGSAAFTTASIQGGQLSLTVPAGTTTYAIAYVCPTVTRVFAESDEFVIEASVQDDTAYTVSCSVPPAVGSVTGNVDVTAIPGATNILISGKQGFTGTLAAASGSISASMPTGTNDIAVVARDGSNNVLAVKILRSQTVPGAINGGSTVVLGPSDEITLQTVTVNNTPAGFIPAEQEFVYLTQNGFLFLGLSSAAQYSAVPTASAQAGDMYFIDSSTDDTATRDFVVGVNQTMSAANPVTINLPPVWSFTGPSAAAFPTFTFSYSGFSVSSKLSYQALISWQPTATTQSNITVTATASFQNGATTLSIPNLTALPGFLPSAVTGSSVSWNAVIFNGDQSLALVTETPSGSGPFVETRGNFTEP